MVEKVKSLTSVAPPPLSPRDQWGLLDGRQVSRDSRSGPVHGVLSLRSLTPHRTRWTVSGRAGSVATLKGSVPRPLDPGRPEVMNRTDLEESRNRRRRTVTPTIKWEKCLGNPPGKSSFVNNLWTAHGPGHDPTYTPPTSRRPPTPGDANLPLRRRGRTRMSSVSFVWSKRNLRVVQRVRGNRVGVPLKNPGVGTLRRVGRRPEDGDGTRT